MIVSAQHKKIPTQSRFIFSTTRGSNSVLLVLRANYHSQNARLIARNNELFTILELCSKFLLSILISNGSANFKVFSIGETKNLYQMALICLSGDLLFLKFYMDLQETFVPDSNTSVYPERSLIQGIICLVTSFIYIGFMCKKTK